MSVQVIILAAGMGTRLGRPHPKPLTVLDTGQSIMAQQFERIDEAFGEAGRTMVVVGFKMDLIMESFPQALFVYNEHYSETNTSKSLLKGLERTAEGGVLWMNGDVVFDRGILESIGKYVQADESFVCVNTETVAEEEVKYTVDDDGYIDQLSKQVVGGLGEAVGINFISSADKPKVIRRLREVGDQDYFERGLELAVELDGVRIRPVDISEHGCVEVDFEDDLARANAMHPLA
jgi:choline kinase